MRFWVLCTIICTGGCSTVGVDMTKPDGTHLIARRSGLFMESKEINGEFGDLKIGAVGSGSGMKALATVTSAAVAAGVNAALPGK